MKIILASRSPRRKELLKKIVSDFQVVPSSFDESTIRIDDPKKFAMTAAEEKAKDVASKYPDAVVIGADTIVVLDGKIFGKPKDIDDAKRTLKELSGKTHQVITGLAVFNESSGKLVVDHELTNVIFNKLDDKEIGDYVKKGSVHDKAGSYAIQDIGDRFIAGVTGDRDNVIGLPITKLKEILRRFS